MARVPYEAYPTAPVGGPEGDQFHIEASPADFGGLIGQGEEKLGAGLAQTGQNLASAGIAKQEFYNQVGADQAFNNLQSSYYKMTYGDPATGKTGIYGLRGEDAVRASQTIGDQMDQVREGIKNSLPNEAMKLQFDQASRRLQMFTMDAIGRHVDNQSSIYAQSVNKASIANQGLAISVSPEDETNYQNSLHALTRAYVRSAQVANGMNASDEIINNAVHSAEQDAIKQRVLSWANKNPTAADSWLQSQKSKLDPLAFDAIQTHIRGLSDKASVAAGISTVMGGVGGGAGPASLKDVIRGQEGSGATAVSVNGAVGKYQVTPGFFQTYAQPGESFNNENDRTAVAERGIDALNAKYNGDASRVAVAYFSGENNVAPPGSPNPWIADKKDGNGTSTSTYVNGVLSRMGGGAAQGGRPYAIGDSLAVGLKGTGSYDGGGQTGANPQTVFNNINSLAPGDIKGRDVVLSTGASNDPSQLGLVSQQISLLKAKGAASVTVLGVGDRSDLAGVNGKLADIAQQNGVQFNAIPSDQLSPDHIHPANYTQLATSLSSATASSHHPEAYGAEAAMLSRARAEAQQRFPDRPDLQKSLIDGVWQEIQQNNALQLKYEAEQAKQKRDGEEAAGQQVVKSLMTPGSNYDDLVKTIRDNPNLTADQKLHLWSIAQTHYAGDAAKDVKTYGPGFWNLYQQVHAAQGDPNRITDVSQLWQHGGPNGDLTLAGIEKLTGEIQGRRTPEGEAEGKMKTGALAYAKHELSFEADLGMTKIRDPKGEGIFNVGFLPAFYKAYDAGIAAGKTPYQLLSKDSPDFIVDKLVGAYKRTPAQISQDMLSENSGEAPSTEQPAQPAQQQPDLNTQAGIIAAYNSGKLTRDQAASALVSKGFARAATAPAPTTPVGPQVPR